MTERARAQALQGTRAGTVSRVVAGAIDLGLAFAALWLMLLFAAGVRYLIFGDELDLPKPGALRGSLVLIVVVVLMFTVAWSGSGRTTGNLAVGLRVVTEQGEVLGWKRALVRATVLVLFIVPATLWILVSRKNAGLHDLACRTAVIYDWRARGERKRPARRETRPGT